MFNEKGMPVGQEMGQETPQSVWKRTKGNIDSGLKMDPSQFIDDVGALTSMDKLEKTDESGETKPTKALEYLRLIAGQREELVLPALALRVLNSDKSNNPEGIISSLQIVSLLGLLPEEGRELPDDKFPKARRYLAFLSKRHKTSSPQTPQTLPTVITPTAPAEPPSTPIAVPVREEATVIDVPHGPSTIEDLQERISKIGRQLKQLKDASTQTRQNLTTELSRLTAQVSKQVEQAAESGLAVKQQAKTKAAGELKSVQDRLKRLTKRLSNVSVSDTAMWQKIGTEIVKLTNQELKLLQKLRPDVKIPHLPHPSKRLMRNATLATAALAVAAGGLKYKPEDFPPPVSLPDLKPPTLTLPNIPPPHLSIPKFNIPPPQTKQVRVGIASAAEESAAPENPSVILPIAVSAPSSPPSPTLIANGGEPVEEEEVKEEVKAEIPAREEQILYPKELPYNEVEKRLGQLQNSTDVVLTESLFTKEIAGLTSERREMVLKAIAAAHAKALIDHYRDSEAIIGLDPGHGGSDVGSSGVTPAGKSLAEKDLTWQLSKLIAEEIYEQSGGKYIVVFLRPENPRDVDLDGDGHITPVERIQKRKALLLYMESQLRPDPKARDKNIAYISVHLNGSPDPSQNGTETYWPNSTGMSSSEHHASSKQLALKLHKRIFNAIRQAGYSTQDRGAKEDPDTRASGPNWDPRVDPPGPYVIFGAKLKRNLIIGEGR